MIASSVEIDNCRETGNLSILHQPNHWLFGGFPHLPERFKALFFEPKFAEFQKRPSERVSLVYCNFTIEPASVDAVQSTIF